MTSSLFEDDHLTSEDVDRILRDLHQLGARPGDVATCACGSTWPCVTIQALDHVKEYQLGESERS